MLVEGGAELIRAWGLVRFKAFQSYSPDLGELHKGEFLGGDVANISYSAVIDTRWALKLINRKVGGRFTCLMLAIAGKRLLNRRGIPNTLVLGVCPSRGRGSDPFGAHAWLRVGQYVIIGQEERAGNIPVASYHSALKVPPNNPAL